MIVNPVSFHIAPRATALSYRLLRPLLFRLDPEASHSAIFTLLHAIPGACHALRGYYGARTDSLPVEIMGLQFENPVGLAAGLDKNAHHVELLTALGFGFIEVGTVTPRPQAGNPRPRLFRLPEQRALINRMGFNSAGAELLRIALQRVRRRCPIGINIGKNKDTPDDRAIGDYVTSLRAVYPLADYVAINVSSPNTPGLRGLQARAPLAALLTALTDERAAAAERHDRYVPLALKIAPDVLDEEIDAIAELAAFHELDAIIATNTTASRPGYTDEPLATQTGGLSGPPLKRLSTHVIRRLYRQLEGTLPIIGVGGIETADDAWEKLVAGADLVQIYTALIYHGPAVIQQIVAGLAQKVKASGAKSLHQAVARARATKQGQTNGLVV